MEFSNFSNEIQLILDIKDRRGKAIRVASVKDIKVKVWTDNPDCFLTFTYHDIQQRSHEDVIVIPQSRMLSLPSGIITYQYQYKTFNAECHEHHDALKIQTVQTDIFWKNRHQNEVISNPAYYQSMEYLNDKIEHERKDRISQFKDLQYYVTEEYSNKLNDEIERAKYREGEIEALLNAFSATTDNSIVELKNKIDEEVKRSNEVDIEMFKYIKEIEGKLEGSVADKEESKKETDDKIDSTKEDLTKLVAEERERATKRENEIENKIDENNNKFNLKDIELNALIEAEVTRAKGEEQRIEALINNSVDSAKDSIKKLKKKVSALEDSTDGLGNKLDKEISDRTIATNELNANLTSEIKRATTEEARIEGKFDDISTVLKSLKELVNTIDSSLNDEIVRSTVEDENTKRLLDILNGNEETVGSILHLIKDSEHRLTDLIHSLQDEFDEVLGGSLDDYATKVYVDERFQHLVGTAPENLDTLEEIAERLQRDDDLFKAIQEILSGKASKEDVYTKAEIDRKEADLNNLIQNETQRSLLAESGLEGKYDTLNSDYTDFKEKVNKHIQEGDANYQEVYNAIVKEETRATNEETKLQNQLDVINGDSDTVGSIAHAIEDCKHYTDDEIEKLKHIVDENEANIEKHIEEANNKFNEIDTALEGKQEKGDYVSYTTDETFRKHIILPNNVNIVGTTNDGTDGRNLIMLSKWNVTDVGSSNCHINLNGVQERPTYNDTKEIALLEDVENYKSENNTVIEELIKRIEVLEQLIDWNNF